MFKHWSENSTNRGSCIAAFIASSLLSALSMEHNNCLRWGLQRRSFSSFDWPVEGIKNQELNIFLYIEFNFEFENLSYVLSKYKMQVLKKNGKVKNKQVHFRFIPNSWSLCRGTLSMMSSSCRRSSTVQGSVKMAKRKFFLHGLS